MPRRVVPNPPTPPKGNPGSPDSYLVAQQKKLVPANSRAATPPKYRGEVAHVGRAGGREVRRRRVRRLRRSGEGGVRSLVDHGSERVVVGGEDGDVDVEEGRFGDGMDLDDVHALEARDA